MNKNDLIGTWKPDVNTQKVYGNITVEFKNNGELVYTIIEEGKSQYIFMTYEIQGNKLITDQYSSPKKEITNFELIDNKLEVYFDGIKSVFFK